MAPYRLAVIDLGSNTFHLLIAEVLEDGNWSSILKDRRYVKIASGGVELIQQDNINRAIAVMKEFAIQIETLEVHHIKAVGTAALREASNGTEVVRQLEEASGIHIDIIDGQQEAAYILKGIKSALPPMQIPCLIMDIGGGSVEFILYKQDELLFAESFKIGVAVLHRKYHHHDPMLLDEIKLLEDDIRLELIPLFEAIQPIEQFNLVGASGSFEVVQDVMSRISASMHWSELSMEGLDSYLTDVIHSDIADRRLQPEIPVERLDYIVVAYILMRLILRQVPPHRLFYCDYALKEGVIAENIALNLDTSK